MYTPDLIAEVKELFPDNTTMHELAESGNAFLGRYLDDSSSNTIHIKTQDNCNPGSKFSYIKI